ncbi:MFS-type transporter SLC18B1 [Nymphon striatum]|nr:MFS-type transporter SLC18B1 [Nymphon striatum]
MRLERAYGSTALRAPNHIGTTEKLTHGKFVMYAKEGTPFYVSCLMCRFMQGVGFVGIQLSTFSIVTQEYSEYLSTFVGIIEMAWGVGYAVGPSLGGFIYDLAGFEMPFFIVSGLLLVLNVIGFFTIKPQNSNSKLKISLNDENSINALVFIKMPDLLIPMGCCMMSLIMITFLDVSLGPLFTETLNSTTTMAGIGFGLSAALYAGGAVSVGYLVDKKGCHHVIQIIGCAFGIIAFLIYGPVPGLGLDPSIPLLMISVSFLGLCGSFVYVPSLGIFLNLYAKKRTDADYADYADDLAALADLLKDAITLLHNIEKTPMEVGTLIGPILGGILVDEIEVGYSGLVLCIICASMAYTKGLTSTDVGIVLAMFSVAILILTFFYSYIITFTGGRLVHLTSTFICAGGLLPFAFVMYAKEGTPFYVSCLMCRFMQGAGYAGIQISTFSIVTQEYSEYLSTFVGVIEMASGVGFAVGPSIGGFIYDLAGFEMPFFIVSGLLFALNVIGFFTIKPQNSNKICLDGKKSINALIFIKIPELLIPMACCILSLLILSFLEVSLGPMFTETLNTTNTIAGLGFGLNASLYATSAVFAGYLADKKNYHHMIQIIGCAFGIIAFLIYGPIPGLGLDPNFLGPILGGILIDEIEVGYTGLVLCIVCAAMALLTIVQFIVLTVKSRNDDEEKQNLLR